MSAVAVLGAFPEPPESPLSAVEMEILPLDLVTEWRRCGMIADFMADYMVHAFEKRAVARSILSTVMNELVENAAKFSADSRTPARASIRHHGDFVHLETRNVAVEAHVERLRTLLRDLARGDPVAVWRARIEGRLGLGIAMLARDYGATIGATTTRAGDGGSYTVCLRVSVSAAEVEQR